MNTPTTGEIRPNPVVFPADFEIAKSILEDLGDAIDQANCIARILVKNSIDGQFTTPEYDVLLAVSAIKTLLVVADDLQDQVYECLQQLKKGMETRPEQNIVANGS